MTLRVSFSVISAQTPPFLAFQPRRLLRSISDSSISTAVKTNWQPPVTVSVQENLLGVHLDQGEPVVIVILEEAFVLGGAGGPLFLWHLLPPLKVVF